MDSAPGKYTNFISLNMRYEPNFYIQSEENANTELASILRASDKNKYAPPVHVMELQGDSRLSIHNMPAGDN